MALNIKRISEVYKLKVYTEDGMYLGDVEDAIITGNKIYGWKIKIADPELIKRGAKGLIVQHQLVKAIGQIMIISKVAYPSKEESEEGKESVEEVK